jgi:O-antigen ligase
MRIKKLTPSLFYTIPLAALILFTTNNFSTGAVAGDSYDPTVSGAFTMYIRMAIYALSIYLFLIKPKANFSTLSKGWPFLLVLTFVAISALWSSHPTSVIVSCIHFIGAGSAAFAASQYFSTHSDHLFPYLSIVFGISITISVITVFALPEIGLESFEDDSSRWRGATGNANGLGRLSSLAIWASVVAFFSSSNKQLYRFAYIVVIIAAIAALVSTQSRTSQTASVLLVALSFLLPQIIGKRTERRKKLLLSLAFTALVILSIASIYSYSIESGKSAAYSQMGRDDSMSGRKDIWEDATRLINLKPIIGWSFDGDRSARDHIDMGVPHFHNGYLDIMVQGGLVGFLIFMIFYLRAFWLIFRLIRFNPRVYAPMLSLLLSILLYNISEVTFGAWSETFWIMQLLVFFMAERKLGKKRRSRNKPHPEIIPHRTDIQPKAQPRRDNTLTDQP